MSTSGPFVLSQVLSLIHRQQFQRYVTRYAGETKVRHFSCRAQWICMAFAQLTHRESLRDIQTCLNALPSRLPHLGLPGLVAKSTLADANETRDWRIYADLAQHLIRRVSPLYADEEIGVDLTQTVYALDATTIDLCLSLFPWARFRSTKAAIKLHTLLNVRGQIPNFIQLTDGKAGDSQVIDHLELEAGSFYIVDRGYVDWQRLYAIVLAGAFYVTRSKKGLRFNRVSAVTVDKTTGLRCDQIVRLRNRGSSQHYPDKLRRIGYRDPETGQIFVFLTNNFDLPALTISHLYKLRWRVELFFKWIKGHLRLKNFYGTSRNAVLTQVWIAMCVYLLVALLKKQLRLPQSLYEILQVLDTHAFSQVSISELLGDLNPQKPDGDYCNQYTFNGL